jgi:hypothetical protein
MSRPIRETCPAGCAAAASDTMQRLRVKVTMHRTMLRPMIVSSCWSRAWLVAGYRPSEAERCR